MGTPLTPEQITERLSKQFGDELSVHLPPGESAAQVAIVSRESLENTLSFLQSEAGLEFDFLVDVTAVDYLHFDEPSIQERFAAVYQLYPTIHNHRFTLKTPVPEDDAWVPSAVELWGSALWAERETHDMYGIRFKGNPDMRRLLMPEDFPGFPLRKDYPLRGRGERDAFPQYLDSGPISGGAAEEGGGG